MLFVVLFVPCGWNGEVVTERHPSALSPPTQPNPTRPPASSEHQALAHVSQASILPLTRLVQICRHSSLILLLHHRPIGDNTTSASTGHSTPAHHATHPPPPSLSQLPPRPFKHQQQTSLQCLLQQLARNTHHVTLCSTPPAQHSRPHTLRTHNPHPQRRQT